MKAPFYSQNAEVDERLKEEVDVNSLPLSDLLAIERTTLADERNVYALRRTMQAGERTFAAWIRTGFSIASSAIALIGLLYDSNLLNVARFVGTILILVGIYCFIYGWIGYYRTYRLMVDKANVYQLVDIISKRELVTVTAMTIILATVVTLTFVLLSVRFSL